MFLFNDEVIEENEAVALVEKVLRRENEALLPGGGAITIPYQYFHNDKYYVVFLARSSLNLPRKYSEDEEIEVLKKKFTIPFSFDDTSKGVLYYVEEGNSFTILQYVQGFDLFEILRRVPVWGQSQFDHFCAMVPFVLEYVQQVKRLHALKELRLITSDDSPVKDVPIEGCIHLDLKPANSILEFGGSLYLIDFDNLQRLGQEFNDPVPPFYTNPYAAPEILNNQPNQNQLVGHKSDIYSIGVMLIYDFFPYLFNGETSVPVSKYEKRIIGAAYACIQNDLEDRIPVMVLEDTLLEIRDSLDLSTNYKKNTQRIVNAASMTY